MNNFLILILISLIFPFSVLAKDCTFLASAYLEYSNGSFGSLPSEVATSTTAAATLAPAVKDGTSDNFCVGARMRFVLDNERTISAEIHHSPSKIRAFVQALVNGTYVDDVKVECAVKGNFEKNTTIVQSAFSCCEGVMCAIPYFNGTDPMNGSGDDQKMGNIFSLLFFVLLSLGLLK